jgi:integrase
MNHWGSKFYLDKKDRKGFYTIYMDIGLGYDKINMNGKTVLKNNRVRLSTGEKIKKRDWDERKEMPREYAEDYEGIKNVLEPLAKKAQQLKAKARRGNITFSKDSFKSELLNSESAQKITMLEALDKYIASGKNFKDVKTIGKDELLKEEFIMLQADKERSIKLDFYTLNEFWLDQYVSFLIEEQENFNTTILGKIAKLKSFINYCVNNGYTDRNPFSKINYRDKLKHLRKSIVWLTQDELKLFYKYNFSEFPKLERVRDVFCFSCYTGLRYSDLKQLAGHHLQFKTKGKENYLSINLTTIKAARGIEIPLLSKNALAIIDKYKGKLKDDKCLPVISNQDFNDYLKEAAEKAEIKQKIEIVRYRGKERVAKEFFKCEKLTVHSGRHSFCIISLEKGMQPVVLQKIVGHSSLDQTMAYVEINDSFTHSEMKKIYSK